MSTEEAVTEALQTPLEQNAQSAEDAMKMLAELQGEAKPDTVSGTSDEKTDHKPEDGPSKQDSQPAEGSKFDTNKSRDRRGHDRSQRESRGRGGFKSKSYRDNIKSDVTTQEESSDPNAIRKQVEFYFSDSNLPNDKFLFSKVEGSKNNPVELKILHSFKRMRHFQPFEAIVEAMKESQVLELTDNDTCVRRREALPESLNDAGDLSAIQVFEDRAMPRSVYVKGFGEEVPSTQFDIEAFFAPFGPTNAVRLRRTDTKLFKGSAFIEFENEDLQKAFLAVDPKPQYKGKDLQIMSKREYCDKKVDDIKSGKIRANNQKSFGGRRHDQRDSYGSKRKRDDEDDRDWRERREQDRKNGYKDEKRQHNRNRDSRGGRQNTRKQETDERGVPLVKDTSASENQGNRESARADAIAKAKAAVEADKKVEASGDQKVSDAVESTEQNGTADVTKDGANAVADSIQEDVDATTTKKRMREEDEDDGDHLVKKLDSKTVPDNSAVS